jgi:hypothetical protein
MTNKHISRESSVHEISSYNMKKQQDPTEHLMDKAGNLTNLKSRQNIINVVINQIKKK